jgi:hypothetical protein
LCCASVKLIKRKREAIKDGEKNKWLINPLDFVGLRGMIVSLRSLRSPL